MARYFKLAFVTSNEVRLPLRFIRKGSSKSIICPHRRCKVAYITKLPKTLFRLINAAVAEDKSLAEMCQFTDTVSMCFTKGLGCPAGAIIAGPSAVIDK